MNLGYFILEMFGKEYQNEFVESSAGKETEAFLWSPIYTIPDLTTIIRVVGDHLPVKVRFSFIRESIA